VQRAVRAVGRRLQLRRAGRGSLRRGGLCRHGVGHQRRRIERDQSALESGRPLDRPGPPSPPLSARSSDAPGPLSCRGSFGRQRGQRHHQLRADRHHRVGHRDQERAPTLTSITNVGLTNWSVYTVSMVAVNAVGSSPPVTGHRLRHTGGGLCPRRQPLVTRCGS
jgi:hypothetical protein